MRKLKALPRPRAGWGPLRHRILTSVKNLRSAALLTGGFTLISTGLGMKFGLWLGLLVAGILTVLYENHLASEAGPRGPNHG